MTTTVPMLKDIDYRISGATTPTNSAIWTPKSASSGFGVRLTYGAGPITAVFQTASIAEAAAGTWTTKATVTTSTTAVFNESTVDTSAALARVVVTACPQGNAVDVYTSEYAQPDAFSSINGSPASLLASVQPRQGILVALQALAGLPGEWSYPTDYPEAQVRHTGVAGQAKTFWSGGAGANLLVSMDGVDQWTAPSGVSISLVNFTGTPSDAFTVILSSAQLAGVFVIHNNAAFDCTEDSSGTIVSSSSSQIFAVVQTALGGGLIVAPIGANVPV